MMKSNLSLALLTLLIAHQSFASSCTLVSKNAKASIDGMPTISMGAFSEALPVLNSYDNTGIEVELPR